MATTPALLKYIDNPIDYKLCVVFVVKKDKKLELAWMENDFAKFSQIYLSDDSGASCPNTLRFHFINSNYDEFDSCINRPDVSVGKELFKLYYHFILSHEPNKFYEKIKIIRSKINEQKFEKIKEYYYSGDVKAAEEYRMSLMGSRHLELLKLTGENADLNYEDVVSGSVRVIFIPEQGVGDEVRWSRLYRQLDYVNVTFACDKRLEPIFKSYLKNAKLLPIKSLYTSRKDVNKTIREVSIALGGKDIFEEYDFIRTNCRLFNILEAHFLKTSMKPFLTNNYACHNFGKIRVRIAWLSAVRNHSRSSRYGLSLSEIIEILPQYFNRFEFYSVQSGMTNDEKLLCKASRINIVEDIDFYNDFKSSADFYSTLDAAVGVSTLNTELAAAVGPTFYHLANAPDIFYMRTGSLMDGHYDANNHVDQLGSNVKTIGPLIGYKSKKSLINKSCLKHALDEILQDLTSD